MSSVQIKNEEKQIVIVEENSLAKIYPIEVDKSQQEQPDSEINSDQMQYAKEVKGDMVILQGVEKQQSPCIQDEKIKATDICTIDEVPIYIQGGMVSGSGNLVQNKGLMSKYATDMIADCGFQVKGVKLEYSLSIFFGNTVNIVNEKIIQPLLLQNTGVDLELIQKSKIIKCVEGLIPSIKTNFIILFSVELIFTITCWFLYSLKSAALNDVLDYEEDQRILKEEAEKMGNFYYDNINGSLDSSGIINAMTGMAILQGVIFTLNCLITLFSGLMLNNNILNMSGWLQYFLLPFIYIEFGLGMYLSFTNDAIPEGNYYDINIVSMMVIQTICIFAPGQIFKISKKIDRLLVIIGQKPTKSLN